MCSVALGPPQTLAVSHIQSEEYLPSLLSNASYSDWLMRILLFFHASICVIPSPLCKGTELGVTPGSPSVVG